MPEKQRILREVWVKAWDSFVDYWVQLLLGLIATTTGIIVWLQGLWPTIWKGICDSYTLQGWIIAPLLLIIAYIVPIYAYRLYIKIFNPSKEDYNHDEFEGIEWHWTYYGGDVEPTSLKPYCAEDHYQLTYKSYGEDYDEWTEFTCEECTVNKTIEDKIDNLRAKILRKVDKKIKTGIWTEVVKKYPKT